MTRQLALALIARGHDVAVLTNRWPAGVQPSETLDGIEVTRLRFPLPALHPFAAARFLASSPAATLALLRYVRRWRPTVVHVIGAGPPSVYLATFHAWLGARLVFTAQGELTFDAHGVFERSATLRAGLRRVLREADAVTACSAFVMRDLEDVQKIRVPSRRRSSDSPRERGEWRRSRIPSATAARAIATLSASSSAPSSRPWRMCEWRSITRARTEAEAGDPPSANERGGSRRPVLTPSCAGGG